MVKEITDANYKELLADTSKPVVIDFWATWCGPCRMVGPVIDELAAEYEDMTMEFGIRNIPTILFFKNGQLVDKQVGSAAKPVFVQKIEALL